MKTRDAACGGPLPSAPHEQVLSNFSFPLPLEMKSEPRILPGSSPPLPGTPTSPVLTLLFGLHACSLTPPPRAPGWGASSCNCCNESPNGPLAPQRGNIHQIRKCVLRLGWSSHHSLASFGFSKWTVALLTALIRDGRKQSKQGLWADRLGRKASFAM